MTDALVSMNQLILGEPIANVLGFSNVTEDITELQDFADNLRGDWSQHLSSHQSQQWSLENITVSFIDGDHISFSITVDFTAGPLAGDQTQQVLPTTNCLLVSLQYVGPRPNRGRVYFGGFTETEQADSAWISAVLFAARDLVEDYRNGVGIGPSQAFLRIVRRPGPNFPVYVTSPVSEVITRLRPATQRRRRL